MNKGKNQSSSGFTLIELMIVVTIIGVLAATAIPGYIGFQEKSRRAHLERTAASAEAELQGWLSSSLAVGNRAAIVEMDTNHTGVVGDGDLTNSVLWQTGVASQYVTVARAAERSPWSNSIPLWVNGPAGNGQIGLEQVGNIIFITAADLNGDPVFQRRVISD